MKRALAATAAIAGRELGSMFRLPVGWIVIALFAFLSGVVFVNVALTPGSPATLRYLFTTSAWLLIPIAPAVSMRLFSDETRSGTIESLRTAPVSDAQLVAGKFLGAATFLVLMLVPSLSLPLVLWLISSPAPDPGPMVSGYLGLVLVGMLYLAVGTLASALTSSQTLAFLGALMSLILVMLLATVVAERAGTTVGPWLLKLSVPRRMGEFARGLIDLRQVVFFVGVTVWLLVLATRVLEAARWR